MSTDLVVVYSPVGGGHKSAALATAEAARARGLRVEVVSAFDHAPRWAGDAYVRAHLTGQSAAPELYGQMYFAANRRGDALEPLRLGLDNLVFGGLADHVRALAPRAVVATHHLPLVVLGRSRRKGTLDAPLLGVVTDYTAHACWAERGVDAWAVPFGGARAELAGHGAPLARIVETGIPVRASFARTPSLLAGALPRVLRVLVTSGGFGHGPMTRIVRSFASVPNVELVVVCGAAEKLAARVAREADEAGVPARVIGFEKDMAARIAEAHVVVGKAGGLTVTETLTAGRPMIVASAVPGNEKLNEAFVVDGGAGIAADADDVGAAVERLRDGTGASLVAMGERARQLVPRHAADAVVDAALGLVRRSRLAAA
ncbi:MAG: diglucosyldiacylglycerol synthase rane anchor synthesis [Labilithrix sp.]|nr:diglucosyldiacylglycerol synthase rane anchor synthesis [Labilithrix sp.]